MLEDEGMIEMEETEDKMKQGESSSVSSDNDSRSNIAQCHPPPVTTNNLKCFEDLNLEAKGRSGPYLSSMCLQCSLDGGRGIVWEKSSIWCIVS